jgi:hypothetical protein
MVGVFQFDNYNQGWKFVDVHYEKNWICESVVIGMLIVWF